jgi:flagellar protein FliS
MDQRTANDRYLESAVRTASPARLRLMLLERGVALAEMICEKRQREPETLVDEWTVTLRDVLGELLSGITAEAGELGVHVADLYVFLLQELTRAEQEPGSERLQAIGRILRIECETWRQVVEAQREQQASKIPAPHQPAVPPIASAGPSVPAGGLDLNV